jgi:hypothetical protein
MGKAIQLLQFWAIISLGLRADLDPETAKPARRARVREQMLSRCCGAIATNCEFVTGQRVEPSAMLIDTRRAETQSITKRDCCARQRLQDPESA